MGYDLYTKLSLGFKVSVDAQKQERRVRNCRHPLLAEGAQFCSTCGKPAWKDEPTNTLGDIDHIFGALGRYEIHQGNVEGEYYYVGLSREKSFSFDDLDQIDLPKLRRDLEIALGKEKINLSGCVFGMHLVLFESY